MEGSQGRGRAFALWTMDQSMNQPWDIEAGSKGVGLDWISYGKLSFIGM